MYLKIISYLMMFEFAILKVLNIAVVFFMSAFLFKKFFEYVSYFFNQRKNKQNKSLVIDEKIYYQFCHIIENLIETIKDEPMKKEYIQTFNILRKDFWEGQKCQQK